MPGSVGRVGHLEAHPIAHPGLGGRLPGFVDRGLVAVDADDGRGRVGLRQHDRRGPVPATDVGDPGPGQQLVLDPVERGNPLRDELVAIDRPEQPLHAAEQPWIVLMPADPAVLAERGGDPIGARPHRRRDLEDPGDIDGAVRISQHRRVLGRQREGFGRAVVLEVAAGDLPVTPLAHQPLLGLRALGQRHAGQWAGGGERGIQAEPVTEIRRGGGLDHGHLRHGLAEERLHLALVHLTSLRRLQADDAAEGLSPTDRGLAAWLRPRRGRGQDRRDCDKVGDRDELPGARLRRARRRRRGRGAAERHAPPVVGGAARPRRRGGVHRPARRPTLVGRATPLRRQASTPTYPGCARRCAPSGPTRPPSSSPPRRATG